MLIRKLIELLNLTSFPFINFDFYLGHSFRTTMNNTTIQQAPKRVNEPDSFEKGQLFEKYIISLFNERHFKLKEWRKSVKAIEGNLPFNHCLPDLELIFMGMRNHRFAVECKWKKKLVKGQIEWANQKKIDVYKKFQTDERTIVFIAIGIGGEPSNPERLYVTPLDTICNKTWISESDLLKFNRKPTRRFFYDTVQLRLW